MTQNRRSKLARMQALGFEALPAEPYNVRHQRARCSCGHELPYYRVDLAERHSCPAKAKAPSSQASGWSGAGPMPASVAKRIAVYFGELAQQPSRGPL